MNISSNMQESCDNVKTSARHQFAATGEVSNLVLGYNGREGFVIPVYQYDDEREMFYELMPCLMQHYGIAYYITVTETWYTEHDLGETPSVRPRDSEMRREAVLVTVQDDTSSRSALAKIERNTDGSVVLGEFEDAGIESVELAGPMAQFLSVNIPRKKMKQFDRFMKSHGDEMTTRFIAPATA